MIVLREVLNWALMRKGVTKMIIDVVKDLHKGLYTSNGVYTKYV